MTKTVDVKRQDLAPEKSIQEQVHERREAMEAQREESDKPRKDFLLTGKGNKDHDFFEVQNYQPEVGEQPHKEVEEFSESEREKWLRTGDLPAAKPNGKAAEKKEEAPAAKPPERPKLANYRDEKGEIKHDDYEKALDKYEADKTAFNEQQAAKHIEAPIDAQLDKEIFEEIGKKRDWWNEEGHADAHKTMPERTAAGIQALTAEEKAVIAGSPVRTMQLNPELDSFLGHAMARLKNLGRVHLELAKDHGIVKRMNEDWVKTANNPKARWATEQSIRYVLKLIDKQAGSVSSGSTAHRPNGADRKLTRAGRPPMEAAGASSSPADDGSSDAAWRRKDLSVDARGELYRERKNKEEADARRRRRR
jgi:hypothetical protein